MRGYGAEHFSLAARAAVIRRDFQKVALKCGKIAQHIDGDIPAAQLAETKQLAVYLIAELQAMIARPAKDSRR